MVSIVIIKNLYVSREARTKQRDRHDPNRLIKKVTAMAAVAVVVQEDRTKGMSGRPRDHVVGHVIPGLAVATLADSRVQTESNDNKEPLMK